MELPVFANAISLLHKHPRNAMENPPRSLHAWQATGRVEPCFASRPRPKGRDPGITRSVPCGHDGDGRRAHGGRSWWTCGHGNHAPCCADAFSADKYGTCFFSPYFTTSRGNTAFISPPVGTNHKQPYYYTRAGKACQGFLPNILKGRRWGLFGHKPRTRRFHLLDLGGGCYVTSLLLRDTAAAFALATAHGRAAKPPGRCALRTAENRHIPKNKLACFLGICPIFLPP